MITATAERGRAARPGTPSATTEPACWITVLSWPLDTDALEATAQRCARFSTSFDRGSPPIPMTTTRLETERPDALVYEQTMDLSGARSSSVYFSFENVDSMGGKRQLSAGQQDSSENTTLW